MLNAKRLAAYKELLEQDLAVSRRILAEKEKEFAQAMLKKEKLMDAYADKYMATMRVKEVEAMLISFKIITQTNEEQYANIINAIDSFILFKEKNDKKI